MPNFYQKPQDQEVLEACLDILKDRPTYGYKRITAMINQKRVLEQKSRYNRKRIHRVMQINRLILPRNAPDRVHTGEGKIMTLHPNTRWCSDCFEIHCFNREKVYVGFGLDTCDREVISFVAQKTPITAKDIQGLMLTCVETRFQSTQAPRRIQWLSDRGSIYRCRQTILVAHQMNLQSCFTSANSPESNGMAEALVKTIKRDYVYVSDCKDADTVLALLPQWFKDYNENAPHSALGMLSPKQYQSKIS